MPIYSSIEPFTLTDEKFPITLLFFIVIQIYLLLYKWAIFHYSLKEVGSIGSCAQPGQKVEQ